MNKQQAAVQFLMSHKDLAILLISRLYPLDKEMLNKYKNKLEKKEIETEEATMDYDPDGDLGGCRDGDGDFHENGCTCIGCGEIRLKDLDIENAMSPADHYHESVEYTEATKNDWIYLGPWQDNLKRLIGLYGIKEAEGVGNEIWNKIFKPVLSEEVVEKILK